MYSYHNEKENRKKWITVVALLVVNLVVTACIAVYVLIPSGSGGGGSDSILAFESADYGQYVLYIGLNDRHTYGQIIPTDQAVGIVNEI